MRILLTAIAFALSGSAVAAIEYCGPTPSSEWIEVVIRNDIFILLDADSATVCELIGSTATCPDGLSISVSRDVQNAANERAIVIDYPALTEPLHMVPCGDMF